MVDATGIEPVTPSMSTRCSPAELRIRQNGSGRVRNGKERSIASPCDGRKGETGVISGHAFKGATARLAEPRCLSAMPRPNEADAGVVDAQRFHGTLAPDESDVGRWSRRRAKQPLYPHEQLIVFEGLRHEVFCAQLDRFLNVAGLIASCQHHHGQGQDASCGLEVLEDAEPIKARHIHIKDLGVGANVGDALGRIVKSARPQVCFDPVRRLSVFVRCGTQRRSCRRQGTACRRYFPPGPARHRSASPVRLGPARR